MHKFEEDDYSAKSTDALCKEFEWILQVESFRCLTQLKGILVQCCRRFPLHLTIEQTGAETTVKPERFLLSNTDGGHQNIKGLVILMGDLICDAELNLRVPAKGHHHTMFRTSVQPDLSWKLQQIQDAGNFISKCLSLIDARLEHGHFHSGHEALTLLETLITYLSRGRTCMTVPKRKTIPQLRENINKKTLKPPLPSDVMISMYVHATKLVLAMYYLRLGENQVEITDKYQAEVVVPWFSDVIVLMTSAHEQVQMLKDKITLFSHYPDAPSSELTLRPDQSCVEEDENERIIVV